MKILITGGAGFIGSHIVDKLVERGDEVIVVDNLSTGKKINLDDRAKLYEMDLISPELEKVFKDEDIDAVCHLAASTDVRKSIKDPLNDIENNVSSLVNLLQLCSKYDVKRFVFSSTGGALYGNTNILPTPEGHPTNPISPYGVDKLTGEHYLYYYNKVHGLPVTILRYSNIYGPRQDRKGEGGVVMVFIKSLIEDVQVNINGDGNQTRDFIYVEDIANINISAIDQMPHSGFHVYNISSGVETSINQLYDMISKKLRINIKPIFLPATMGEISRSCLDNSLAKKELNIMPLFGLSDGINKTIEYLKN